jgi:hypothetical protein
VLDELAGFLAGQGVVEGFQEDVFVDEVSGELFLGIEQLGLLHLLERLAVLQCLLHRVAGCL